VTEALGLRADFSPTIVLDKGGSTIRAKANTGTDIYIGYAVPGNNLIALDTSRVYARPLTLRTVLKHEVCHLILHSHLQKLPRWLDEGVCQWVSDGLPDILMDGGGRSLQEALMAGTLIPISTLMSSPLIRSGWPTNKAGASSSMCRLHSGGKRSVRCSVT